MSKKEIDMGREPDGTLTSKVMSEMIVDSLIMAGYIKSENFDKAVEVVEEDIDVRKSIYRRLLDIKTMDNEHIDVEKSNCHAAASMAIDALIDAGIVSEKDSLHAIEIVEEELIVRKTLRKL